jgi:alkane 1-monooxygenase
MTAIVAQIRFAMLPAIMVLSLVTFTWGGTWLWAGGVLLLGLNLVADAVGDDYVKDVDHPHRPFLDAVLYMTAPLMALMVIGLLLYTASPDTIMARLSTISSIAVAGTASWLDAAAVVLTTGILAGCAGVSFAHELIHRTTRAEWLLGQVLLALCLHPSIALEHVHGHHRNVGTTADPTTAPRGMGFWRYLPRTVAGEIRGAAAIEAVRLRRRGQPVVSTSNRFLHGVAILATILVIVFHVAGLSGLAAFVASGLIALVIVELGNYVTHYGIVRVPGQPICPRHSWNGPRFISTSTMVNAPRHSHHHRSAGTRYWDLTIIDGSAILPYGSAIMSAIALVPPLWFRVIGPPLADWDARLASAAEWALLSQPQSAA